MSFGTIPITFLRVPNTSITSKIVGKILNLGLTMVGNFPLVYRFYGHENLIKWLIKKPKDV